MLQGSPREALLLAAGIISRCPGSTSLLICMRVEGCKGLSVLKRQPHSAQYRLCGPAALCAGVRCPRCLALGFD